MLLYIGYELGHVYDLGILGRRNPQSRLITIFMVDTIFCVENNTMHQYVYILVNCFYEILINSMKLDYFL